MPRLQFRDLPRDAENRAEKIFEMRRQLDDQLRARFVLQRGRVLPGRQQTMMQLRAGLLQVRQKLSVQAGQTLASVEILYTALGQRSTLKAGLPSEYHAAGPFSGRIRSRTTTPVPRARLVVS